MKGSFSKWSVAGRAGCGSCDWHPRCGARLLNFAPAHLYLCLKENHHTSSMFSVLLAPGQGRNFLSNLSLVDYKQLRATIIALVLATDMKRHFSILGQAKTVSRITSIT